MCTQKAVNHLSWSVCFVEDHSNGSWYHTLHVMRKRKKSANKTFDENETETQKSSINVIRLQTEHIICANEMADSRIANKEITQPNVDDRNVQKERHVIYS